MSQLTRSVHQLDENAGRVTQFGAQKPATRMGAQRAPTGGVFKPLAVGANPTRAAFRDISNVAQAPVAAQYAAKKQAAAAPAPHAYASAPVVSAMTDDEDYVAPAPAPTYFAPKPVMPAPVLSRAEQLALRGDVPAFTQDVTNPQMVTDYVDDIMAHLRKSETRHRANETYMSHQTDINAKMREILIDWLIEVHLKFKLRQETLHLTVNIIDRFLSTRPVQRSKLQLVGCTSMLIAAKYEEIYAPEVQDFVYVSDSAYTREQIISMESVILNELKFNVTVPYSMRFTERYVRLTHHSPESKELVNYFAELTLQDYKFLRFLPSTIAAASVSLSLHLTGAPSWSPILERETGYTEGDIRECVMDLWHLAAKENPKYRAVRRKYSSSKFFGVARITIHPPAEEAEPTA